MSSLTPRSFEKILLGMVIWFRGLSKKVTDFSIGSTIRTLFEAVAMEIEELYVYFQNATEYAIKNSLYETFGFKQRATTKSLVLVTFTAESAHSTINIPKGFQVKTSEGLVFETIESASITSSLSTLSLMANCTVNGPIGNIDAATITEFVDYLEGLSSVTNLSEAYGGTTGESESSRQKRFILFISTLARGTEDAIRYAISTVPVITSALIKEEFPGVVSVYVSTNSGLVSDDTLSAVETAIDLYRAAGIQFNVASVTLTSISATVSVGLDPDYDVDTYEALISAAITNYILNRGVGEDFVPSHLIAAIINIDSEAIKSCTVSVPAAKQVAGPAVKWYPGTVTVTVTHEEDEDA